MKTGLAPLLLSIALSCCLLSACHRHRAFDTEDKRSHLGKSVAELTARMGEHQTEQELDAPFRDVAHLRLRVYRKNGLWCYANFLKNKCVSEAYGLPDEGAFTGEQIQALLEVDASGARWKEVTEGSTRFWRRSDGGAQAMYPTGPHKLLAIFTPAFEAAADKSKAEEAKSKKDAADKMSSGL